MKNQLYNQLKQLANFAILPCSIMSVEKNEDGSCGDIRFFAINNIFRQSYYDLFASSEGHPDITLEEVDDLIEGQLYTYSLPKEPKFEDICFKAAWEGKHIHTYVDTTKMYGYWTEDILLPIVCDHEANIAYCQFMYTLNKEMDTGKFGTVPPDISSFVIKTCLEIQSEHDFYTSMDIITKDVKEFTDSFAASIMTVDTDRRSFEVISECVRNNELCIKDIFAEFPYEIVESWEGLITDTNNIIIKNEKDMAFYEKKAYAWVQTLRSANVESLCLFPLIHNGMLIGYLYITNFDVANITRIKETIELVSFFLSAEVANHALLEKLEYLSNVDTLTGVFNRNCMNINVDELSLKLKLEPRPFGVAFFDLNGLKSINDNGGHNSGDKLLKDAAKVLKDVFSADKIYRAGGDEFVVISVDTTEDEFLTKVATVRKMACDPDWLNFAIGHYFDEKKGKLRLAMRYADENMYEDKNAFYEAHPEKRR